jgi:hypothetical protein
LFQPKASRSRAKTKEPVEEATVPPVSNGLSNVSSPVNIIHDGDDNSCDIKLESLSDLKKPKAKTDKKKTPVNSQQQKKTAETSEKTSQLVFDLMKMFPTFL